MSYTHLLFHIVYGTKNRLPLIAESWESELYKQMGRIIIGVTIIFGIQLLLSLGIIYHLAGNRWFTASVCLIAGWFGLISWFLAGMALTNVWLRVRFVHLDQG